MEDNKLETTYESKNFLVSLYFRWKVDKAIRMANLKKYDVILDFGCGGGWLERKLKNYNVKGYDTNPEKTQIRDYRKMKPTKIFALDVFEHIPIEETKKILENFKKMSNEFDLIVSQPTENWLSRKVRKLVGKTEVPAEHITRYEEIVKLLKENFILEKKANFFTVTHIFVFKYRKN
ncbi:hypothetical protein HY449_02330 [Candidatus Pacearchaeota archaeon]|nr:hypothetical protein [Candidatus Pacearchaeota archaeon]